MLKKYQICTKCIMDTSDPEIVFDKEGVCNHCHCYYENKKKFGYMGEKSEKKLDDLFNVIKEKQKEKQYDCLIGLSGGVDSAYLTYLAHSKGLRILAVHVDAGWNSKVAVENIRKICTSLNIELQTIVIDWNTIKELQRAYMFSGLPNLDIPQDHVFLAAVYEYARKNKIKYILNGSNIATEGVLPKSWGYAAIDYKAIKDIYRNFGRNYSLKKYPHFNLLQYLYYQKKFYVLKPLNYIPYSKQKAIEELEKKFDWKYYGGKHWESEFTKFFQAYYLPQKFGYDKNRAHLSSLILNKELTREKALIEIENKSGYSQEEIINDRDYILEKLDISLEEWNKIMKGKNKTEDDYASNKKLINFFVNIKHKIF